MTKTLYLTLHKKWFDEILSGNKKVEYRDKKEYWRKRLFNPDGSAKDYDEIIFSNGYGLGSRKMRVRFLEIKESEKYEIILGEILETFNR